jgi:hypothetical protein
MKNHPAVVRGFSIVHRARMVEQPVRFALNELRRTPQPQRYRPRGAAVDVLLRHGTSDLDILDEVFSRRLYRVPPPVRHALPPNPRVLDLGGHIGLFGAWATTQLHPATLTSVEADPANAALLRETGHTWHIIETIAATEDTELPFATGGFAESQIAAHAPLRPARDALPLMAEADLVKIDIEGGEWPILTDPRFAQLPTIALVIEYHPAGCPAADPRAFVHDLLAEAGYRTQEIEDVPLGAGMLWAWRQRVSSS